MKNCTVIVFLILSASGLCQGISGSLLWKFNTGAMVIGTPLIENEKIYYGNTDGNFFCQSVHDGKLLWKYSAGKAIRTSATLAENNIYFGSEDGGIYALNASTGVLSWKFNTKGERSYDTWDYYRSTPRYSKGLVYVGSGDGNIYAIQANYGKLVWKYLTGDVVHADPVIVRDTLYIGSFDGFLYCINSLSGKLVWKFKTMGDRFFPKGEIQKAVLVKGDDLYFGSRDYNLYALNRITGTGLWNRKEAFSWIIATPFEKNGKLYYGTSDSHSFYAVNSFNGEVQWKKPLNMRVFGTAASFDTLIISGCFNGFLYGFDEQTGKIVWSFQTMGSKEKYDSIYDTTGQFRKDFVMYGNDEKITLQAEQKILALGSIISSPVIRDGIIYFASTDGNLYAVRISAIGK